MATYYVDGAVGNDANAGTSEGAGNAWATIDKAMNTVAAGDKVWVKASATYSEMATMDTAGAAGSPITFEGYTSTVGDNGRVTVDGTGRNNGFVSALGGVSAYYVFRNFIVQNCDVTGFAMGTATDYVTFINCRANNNGGWGFQIDNSGLWMLCDVYSNTSGGIDGDSSCHAYACRSHSNSGVGIFFNAGSPVIWNCLVYNNAANDGIKAGANAAIIIACTLDGENTGDEGVLFGASGSRYVIINNIIYDWATGLSAGTDIGEEAVVFNNLFNSNTADVSNLTTGDNVVTSAPGFTDEGSDDYTLASGSAAKAAGADAALASLGTSYTDIGALQREEPAGGGGGLLVHPGTSGGARG